MARPIKQTVEYFSHDANASTRKTLSILFNNFQHDGVSAWWQLLEQISGTNNHVINIRNSEDFEYLASIMRFTPEKLRLILNKIAELTAIDPELYAAGVIWSQNFVNRLEPVYKARKQPLPIKPSLPVLETGLSVPVIQHSKESKESKEREPPTPTAAASTVNSLTPIKTDSKNPVAPVEPGKDNTEQDPNITAMALCYEQNIGMLTPKIADELRELSKEFTPEWFSEAVSEACKASARKLNYVIRILERWKVEGFKSSRGGQSYVSNRQGVKQLETTAELVTGTERFIAAHPRRAV